MSQTDEMRYPWERLPGESDRAWAAFQHFLKQPPQSRSAIATYRELYKGNTKSRTGACSRIPQFMQVWIKRFRWRERASAYDNYLAQQELAAEEKLRQEWREYRRKLLAAAFAKAADYLDALDPTKVPGSLSQVTRLLDTVFHELRVEYEAPGSDADKQPLPTIVFANVSLDQYQQPRQPDVQVVEAFRQQLEQEEAAS